MREPLVSVIIPTFKRPTGLKNAIQSVLSQNYSNIEIIVIDDNNPDTQDRYKTEEVMSNFQRNSKITYLKHSKNKNGSAARNTGIKAARGEFIAFLDNDDQFLPNKIRLQIEKIEECGHEYGVVYTKFKRMKNGKIFDKGIENRSGIFTEEILKGSFYISAGSNILVRSELVKQIKGFNENFNRRQDLEFLIRLSLLTRIASVNEYCLIINKDDRSNEQQINTIEYERNKNEFLSMFKSYINKQSNETQNKILLSLELGELRNYISTLNVYKILKFKRKNNVSYYFIVRYIWYLLKRRLLKLCYGFPI